METIYTPAQSEPKPRSAHERSGEKKNPGLAAFVRRQIACELIVGRQLPFKFWVLCDKDGESYPASAVLQDATLQVADFFQKHYGEPRRGGVTEAVTIPSEKLVLVIVTGSAMEREAPFSAFYEKSAFKKFSICDEVAAAQEQ